MDRIIVLGSANAVADPAHENTHLLFQAGGRTLLVDCPGSPMSRLLSAGVDPLSITDLLITHFHPDHVSGVPLLLMDLWLLGRSEPLNIYGLESTLELVEKNMDLFGWQNWPGFFPVHLLRHPGGGAAVLLETGHIRLSAAEVCHLIPTLGLRIDMIATGKSCAYSCDTEPCPAVVQLAAGVDVLLHEAAGPGKGHTSPGQAGEIAASSGAHSLYLIHYPPAGNQNAWLGEARAKFTGPVEMARDYMEISLA